MNPSHQIPLAWKTFFIKNYYFACFMCSVRNDIIWLFNPSKYSAFMLWIRLWYHKDIKDYNINNTVYHCDNVYWFKLKEIPI